MKKNENEFTVDESLYRSKSAPKLHTNNSHPKQFRASKLPTFNKNYVLEDLNRR